MPTRKTELPTLEPDPLAPEPADVERYIEALQGLSKGNEELARRAAWNQIRLAGARAPHNRPEAYETLARMFKLGAPPSPPLDGPLRGIFVTPTLFRPADSALRGLASAWLPWLGKRFHASEQGGDNLMTPSARIPSKVLWPSYVFGDAGGGNLSAFRFRTYVSAGTVDPDIETLKIDYDNDENPKLLIRDILDELVEIVRGAYLGKVLLRRGGDWHLFGYFALEPALRAEEPGTESVADAGAIAPAPA